MLLAYLPIGDEFQLTRRSGGTSGCVVAARLAENPEISILLIEAGQHNKDLENVHMAGGCVVAKVPRKVCR